VSENDSQRIVRQALAYLVLGAPGAAVEELVQAGVDRAEAWAWTEALHGSSDPLEAAIGRQWKSIQQASTAATAEAPEDEEARLVAGMHFEFQPGSLDAALDVLFRGSVQEQDYARLRAMHLCRLANSFCWAWRQGECTQQQAQALIRGGAEGFSDAAYARVWQNALHVTEQQL
jgi:hypothetical protein